MRPLPRQRLLASCRPRGAGRHGMVQVAGSGTFSAITGMLTRADLDALTGSGLTGPGADRLAGWTRTHPQVGERVQALLHPAATLPPVAVRTSCGMRSDVTDGTPALAGRTRRLMLRVTNRPPAPMPLRGRFGRDWTEAVAVAAGHRLIAPITTTRVSSTGPLHAEIIINGIVRASRWTTRTASPVAVLCGDLPHLRATGRGRWWYGPPTVWVGDCSPRDLFLCVSGQALLGALIVRAANDGQPLTRDPRSARAACITDLWAAATGAQRPAVFDQPGPDGTSVTGRWEAGDRQGARDLLEALLDAELDRPVLGAVTMRQMARGLHRGCGSTSTLSS